MDAAVPAPFADAGEGAIIETSPAACAIMQDLAMRIAAQGGAILAIDYGYVTTRLGYSLQAVKSHSQSDPMASVGEQDLTVHVDFSALAAAARAGGASVYGPVEQGAFLYALGLSQRTETLIANHPERADALAAERDRLATDDGMGTLFKVMAITAPHWPQPEGF
jgi:SAM-dependent MidA family methyltransferase